MILRSVLRRLVHRAKRPEAASSPAAHLTEGIVWEVYESLLGRPPESSLVVAAHVGAHRSFEDFVRSIAASPEFRERIRPVKLSEWSLDERVQHDADPRLVEDLFSATAKTWDGLGASDALGSVLTDFASRSDQSLEPDLADFFASGRQEVEDIERRLRRNALPSLSSLDGLELGCGVGRVTRALSVKMRSLTALDISVPHLNRCRELVGDEHMASQRMILRHLDSFVTLQEASMAKTFFYTAIVLQHNPPPVQIALLRTILSALAAGAVAMFQFVWAHPSYSYRVAANHSPSTGHMEMHALPLSAVLQLLEEEHFAVISAEPAGMTLGWGSDIMITAFKREQPSVI